MQSAEQWVGGANESSPALQHHQQQHQQQHEQHLLHHHQQQASSQYPQYPPQQHHRDLITPPPMTANTDGPVDPLDFYRPYTPPTAHAPQPIGPLSPPNTTTPTYGLSSAARSFSRSPTRSKNRAASTPVSSSINQNLSSVRSQPVLLPSSRQPGTVKDIANRFDQRAVSGGQPALSVRTSNEKYRRPLNTKSSSSRSPTDPAKTDSVMVKLQKRRPGQPKSPAKSPAKVKSPHTSFDSAGSFTSNATALSTKSAPHAAFSPKKSRTPVKGGPPTTTRPLFGEITSDGQWNGNFELGNYGPLPTFHSTSRRSSDGGVSLGHGRSQSHQNMLSPDLAQSGRSLAHQRSRSDVAYRPAPAPSMPNLNSQNIPALSPSPQIPRKQLPDSRIPVRGRQESADSNSPASHTRAASEMSNPSGRNRLSKSPKRKENDKPSPLHARRYNPPTFVGSGQTLSAKIVAPLPKMSPPLRSSRPRQPVSSATTAASRARAAGDRLPNSTSPSSGRKPSEQWLGKPYDPQKERTRRKIPELGKVDFAERRARIQKAISQNLEEQEIARPPSRVVSRELESNAVAGAQQEETNVVDRHQADEMDRETEALDTGQTESPLAPVPTLNVETADLPERATNDVEPVTAGSEHTEFEDDSSPVVGRPAEKSSQEPSLLNDEPMTLLTPATYQPPAKNFALVETVPEDEEPPMEENTKRTSLLENAMLLRQQTPSSTTLSSENEQHDSPSADDSTSDPDDRWGLNRSLMGDQGSIQIMLDGDTTATHLDEPWTKESSPEFEQMDGNASPSEIEAAHAQNQQAFTSNSYTESPVDGYGAFSENDLEATPRKRPDRDETLKPVVFNPQAAFTVPRKEVAAKPAISRALEEYQSNGTVTPELLEEIQRRVFDLNQEDSDSEAAREIQRHIIDLNRMSENGGSDAIMVQNLLDSIAVNREPEIEPPSRQDTLQPISFEIPEVRPDTPSDAGDYTGTAVVYGTEASYDGSPEARADEDSFDAQIRKANEDWERQQRGDDVALERMSMSVGVDDDFRPTPPPKDAGYTPRSSIGPGSATFPPANFMTDGLRISTSGMLEPPQGHPAEMDATPSPQISLPTSPTVLAPPQPDHAPPPPPPLPFGMSEVPIAAIPYAGRVSTEQSPRIRRQMWDPSPASSRPSMDSMRLPPQLPASNSMSSFTESMRQNSADTTGDHPSKLSKTASPGPEQKRLQKRRHIIKELLDTEMTYHQDLKIIEDIYKATVGELVSAEDKKTLFGNCDEIERFSLQFYDQLRKAVVPIYTPSKKMVWPNKRGSMSTTQSDSTAAASVMSTDPVEEEKDRSTMIGKVFLEHLPRMEHIYGAYLKNHDAANQRLSALQTLNTVKCWLDECHNNASDITSAWDLDSLLVKPTQRLSKYPLMLQQLLDTTPSDHPDHEALTSAAKDSIGMLTRINEAKKRADLVEQMIGRKPGKDSDLRTGIAKAFGRRTEKLRERVGINEAFQDPDFDALAHKFGGHFIRLQICMRDIQDYLNRVDKATEQISNLAAALELWTDVSMSSQPVFESKWRGYGQAIRQLAMHALPDHKAAIQRRVITPMIACIKLHENPQHAIAKRKKHIVDYAKCKSIEKRGEKPDRKTVEASEMYEALNDQLKIELPKLYELTGSLVRSCLNCFIEVQLHWQQTWDRKLKTFVDASDITDSMHGIVPEFQANFELVVSKLTELGICNGSVLAESANFLSPTTTLVDDSNSSYKRPSTINGSKRTMSMGSEGSPSQQASSLSKRHSGNYTPDTLGADVPSLGSGRRMRSSSSLSNRGTHATQSTYTSSNRPWSNSNATPPSSFTASRPSTGTIPSTQYSSFLPPRANVDTSRSPRPTSGATYVTARGDQPVEPNTHRFSGIFTSALPPDSQDVSIPSSAAHTPSTTRPMSPISSSSANGNGNAGALSNVTSFQARTTSAPGDMQVLFVCASLFEFNIEKTRREAGYPYLTYVQGEVFDVIAQKGELWLAKNQDDSTNGLGWIWEQHFVILSQD